MMFWKSASSTTTTTKTTSTPTTHATTRASNGAASSAPAATIPSYVISEQRRSELLLAARANRVSWIDGVDEATVAANGVLERSHKRALSKHAGSSIPPHCQQALEAISTEMQAVLSSLDELKRQIMPNRLGLDAPSSTASSHSTATLMYNSADGTSVPYRTIFQDLYEHDAKLRTWQRTHSESIASSPQRRKRMTTDDKEMVFLLAYREFVALLKSPRAAELVYQIQSFVKTFETSWDLARMLEHRAPSERPGAQVQAFIDKLVTQLRHNDKLLDLLDDECPPQVDDDASTALRPTEFLTGTDDWSADLLHEVLEAFVMEKVYAKALTPTPQAAAADAALYDRLASLAFVDFCHLDLPTPQTDAAKAQWRQLVRELQDLPLFLSPRRKMDCVLRVCQGLTTLLASERSNGAFPSADEFLPGLIYLLLQANPRELQRNVSYILEYRCPTKLVSEPGYFFTHVRSSLEFLEHVDGSLLTIAPDDFERGLRASKQQVMAAVAAPAVAVKSPCAATPADQAHDDASLPTVLDVRARRLALQARLA